jgi:RNA polymerase sigma-70 factor (ECF subfamily)
MADEKQHENPPSTADASAGARATPAHLVERVYEQLRQLAGGYFQNERASHTLQPTALVHEAYLRLAQQDDMTWRNEGQFYALAARAMRHILVDHARGKKRSKRGGGWQRVQIETVDGGNDPASGVDLIALDEALNRLAELDSGKARLVELRFFAGMTLEDAADALGMARSTASEHWRMARAWLHQQLGGNGP